MATAPLANNTGSVTLNTVTQVSTTATSTVTTSTQLNITTVSETAYTMIRPKTITFLAEGLKPNTRYYPFFAGVYIGSFCSTDLITGTAPAFTRISRLPRALNPALTADIELVTDALGRLVGAFYLPANTFTVGSHRFVLVDNVRTVAGSNNTLIPDPIYGSAEAQYEANGILKNMSTQATTTAQVNTAITTTVSNINEVTVTLPPIVQCQRRFFEYAITSSNDVVFAVPSNSPTPPAASSVSQQTGRPILDATTTYLNTSVIVPNQTYYHYYAQRSAFGGTASQVQVFRQEWVGISTDASPSLSNFKPSGLTASQTVTILTPWTTIDTVVCPLNLGYGTPTLLQTGRMQAVDSPAPLRQVDPLAQSFLISSDNYPSGVFLTSIGLYFRTVDQSTPVTLEIRNMTNGVPGQLVLPGGRISMPGSACSQSADASISTVFRFDFPVYLAPNQEYCFVVRSSSLGYNVWCSKTGELDIRTGRLIDTNSYLGVLFKSENNLTWIPDSYEDMKFDLNIASFSSSVVGDLVLKPQTRSLTLNKNGTPTVTSVYVGNAVTYPLSYIRTTNGSKTITINLPMHGMQTGDYLSLTDIAEPTPATRYNNILFSQLVGTHEVTVIDGDTVEVELPGSNLATRTGIINVQDPSAYVRVDPGVFTPQPDFTSAVSYVNSNTLAPSTVPSTTNIPSIVAPSTPSFSSTQTFTAYVNFPINELMIDYLGAEFPGAEIIESINTTSAQSTAGSETPYQNAGVFTTLQNPREFYRFESPQLIATPENETVHATSMSSNKSITVRMAMTTSNKFVSPVVDTNGMSLIVRTYAIDNQEGEIGDIQTAIDLAYPSGPSQQNYKDYFNSTSLNSEIISGQGKAAAKYKSTIQRLTTPYSKISIFVVGTCPDPAIIDAYVRVSGDETTHIDRNWEWVPLEGVYGTSFVPSMSDKTTTEWFYELTSSVPFTVYDVKLVMRSTNNSIVPKIYGIRTITN